MSIALLRRTGAELHEYVDQLVDDRYPPVSHAATSEARMFLYRLFCREPGMPEDQAIVLLFTSVDWNRDSIHLEND